MSIFDNNKILNNFLWRFLERITSQALMVLVTIILARLLAPSVFGIIALVTVFNAFMQIFIDSGMGSALIQKKDADDLDFSSVFFFNLAVCLILYVCIFLAAPVIAEFYKMPELVKIVRVLSLTLIISGLSNIQQAYVSRFLLFKKFFYATIVGAVGGGIAGIWLAFSGFGVWALVVQNLLTAFLGTLVLWYTVNWRPKFIFSVQRLKGLFSYGWKLLISALLDTGYRNLASLIIGKIYSTADLAFYERGRQFPNLIVDNLNTAIDSVLLPVMSAQQDDSERVRLMTRRAIQISTFLMMPIMMCLAVCAESIVRLVLTEKWLPCVFFLQIFCCTFAFWPVHTSNLNAIKALGRSDLFLKLEIIKKTVGLLTLYAAMYISLEAMALSMLVTSVLSQIINSWPNWKLLNYGYLDQVKDMLPQIGLSCVMGAIIYCVRIFHWNDWITLLIQISLGAIVYMLASWLLHIESFEYTIMIVKGYLKKM